MNWDDLKIVAAVREAGTYAGAGARLRLDETTVARRLQRIERSLEVRLFEAVDGRRRVTPQGEAVLAHVDAVAEHIAAIGQAGATVTGVSGRVRIASTSSIAEEVLALRAGELLMRHPSLTLQFLTSSENVRFSRWEADLAIRLRKPDRGDFSISRLADFRLCFVEPDATVHQPIVCAFPPDLDRVPESQFLKAKGLQQCARCVTDNLRVIRALLGTRQAVGLLPDYACGDLLADGGLKVTPLPTRREVWLLVQNHLRRDRAARTVIDWIRDCFRALASVAT
jgi:DNA-binding transcriptional LysR family regulator